MRKLLLPSAAATLLLLAGCATPAAPEADSPDADSATHCSEATQQYALSQAAENATIATDDQLAQAPDWLPAPACATISTVSSVWIYPVATRQDFENILELLRQQGHDVEEAGVDPDFVEVYGDDYYVSLTAAGHNGAPTQVLIVNVD